MNVDKILVLKPNAVQIKNLTLVLDLQHQVLQDLAWDLQASKSLHLAQLLYLPLLSHVERDSFPTIPN